MKKGLKESEDGRDRCWWGADDGLYSTYHDREWGRPVTDDVRLFEKICLEGFQSGLSWLTILRKRENFRMAFRGFEFEKVARFGERDVQRLLKEMRKSVPKSGLMEKNLSMDWFKSMFDEAISKEVSKGTGIGMSKVIYEQLTRKEDVTRRYSNLVPNGGKVEDSAPSRNAAGKLEAGGPEMTQPGSGYYE